MTKKSKAPKISEVFVLLSSRRQASEFVEKADAEAPSDDENIRGIIDAKAGFICYGAPYPRNAVEERLVRIETDDPKHTKAILGTLPDVDFTADSRPRTIRMDITVCGTIPELSTSRPPALLRHFTYEFIRRFDY